MRYNYLNYQMGRALTILNEQEFINYCHQQRKLSEETIKLNLYVIKDFFGFYSATTASNSFKITTNADIRDYLHYLSTERQLSPRTVNKYLTNLKRYFTFLYGYGLIDKYPLFDIKGITYNRNITVYINWLNSINNFIGSVSVDTIRLLSAISLGYKPEELLNLSSSCISKVNNNVLKTYLEDHLIFAKSTSAFFLDKRGHKMESLKSLYNHTKPDEEIIKMPLSPYKLRLGYLYTFASNPRYTDSFLLSKLRCSPKRLAYYKENAQRFNLVDFS